MCKELNTPAALSANLLSTLQQHLSGEEKMYDACLKVGFDMIFHRSCVTLLPHRESSGNCWS